MTTGARRPRRAASRGSGPPPRCARGCRRSSDVVRTREQVDLRPAERRGSGARVGRPDRRQEQELRRVAPLPETGQDVYGRRVRPLQILNPQDEWRILGEGFERRHYLTEHARSSGHVGARGKGSRRVLGERRQVREPARCVAGERRRHHLVLGRARQTREQVEQRIVGLGRSRQPHALRPGRPDGVACRRDAEERLAEGDVLPIPASPVTKAT